MKIKKLQGGGSASPWSVYVPQVGSNPMSPVSPTSVQGEAKEAGFSKEMIKLMLDDTLPSDLEVFFKNYEKFFGGLTGAGGIEALTETPFGFNMVVQQLNKMKHNKKKYEGIESELYNNGGYYEPAITASGGLIAMDKTGATKEISLSDYNKSPEEYKLINNNELMSSRANDYRLGFDQRSLDTLRNGVGFKSITTKIKDVMDKLKYASTTNEQYMSEEDRSALRGLTELYKSGKNPDGTDLTPEEKQYIAEERAKYKEVASADGTIKSSTSSKQADLNSAFQYIMSSLSDAEKTLLGAKAIQRGEKDINKGIINTISYYMNSTYGPETSRTYTGGTASSSNLKPKEDNKNQGAVTFKSNIIEDRYPHFKEQINLGGKYSIVTDFRVFNKPVTPEGKPLGVGDSLLKVYDDAFGGLVDQGEVYIGDKKIDPSTLDRIAYTGEKGAVVRLPYTNVNGVKEPDFKILRRIEEANDEIRTYGYTDDNEIAGIYQKHNILQYMSGNSKNDSIFADFVQLPVYAPQQSVDPNSQFVTELGGEEVESARRILRKAYTGKTDGKLDYENWWGGNGVYRTSAFISLNRNIAEASVGNSELTTTKKNNYDAERRQHELNTKRKQEGAVTGADVYK